MNNLDIMIVGGGISGLACAAVLKRKGVNFLLLEQSDRLGGVIRSERRDGFLYEYGPNTLSVSKAGVGSFLREAGLWDAAWDASPHSKKRFIVQDNELRALPLSPGDLIRNPFLSGRAKWRMLGELFVSKGKDPDETIAEFFRRRLGEEVLTEMVSPFVSGIFAGDPEKLILRHSFPSVYEWEQQKGGLFKGMIKGKKNGEKSRMISWMGGLEEMVEKISRPFSDHIRLSTPVEKILGDEKGIRVVAGSESYRVRKLILAVSGMAAAQLLKELSPEAEPLKTIPYAPMGIAHLGFRRSDISHPLDGFGMLISRKRNIRTLGALFMSSLFPERAPQDHVLLTAFLGGRTDPQASTLSDEELVQIIQSDLKGLIGIRNEPVFRKVVRWIHAIPQYESGHDRILESCRRLETEFPGLHFLGSYRGGISLQDCILNGVALGERLV